MGNKRKRKWIWIGVLCAAVLIGAVVHVQITLARYDDPETVLSQASSDRIIAMFQDEIAMVEQECGITIDYIDKTNLEYIKDVAIPNLGNQEYEFQDLMTCLGDACAKYAPWWDRAMDQCPVCGSR